MMKFNEIMNESYFELTYDIYVDLDAPFYRYLYWIYFFIHSKMNYYLTTTMKTDEKIKKLEDEIDKLKDCLFEVTSELNYSLYRELAELVRDIYKSINTELKTKKSELTKKEMLNNLKDYLDDFGKIYKFRL